MASSPRLRKAKSVTRSTQTIIKSPSVRQQSEVDQEFFVDEEQLQKQIEEEVADSKPEEDTSEVESNSDDPYSDPLDPMHNFKEDLHLDAKLIIESQTIKCGDWQKHKDLKVSTKNYTAEDFDIIGLKEKFVQGIRKVLDDDGLSSCDEDKHILERDSLLKSKIPAEKFKALVKHNV